MEPLISKYSIGVDPGWVSMGAAVVKATDVNFKFDIEFAHTFDPSENNWPEHNIENACLFIMSKIPGKGHSNAEEVPVSIERYVSYGPVRSTHGEEILEVIGMLRMRFYQYRGLLPVGMHKAIDWKTKLCQTLVRYAGFDNPSSSLDKKFSIAAAKHITTNHELISDDHRADAICLAAFPQVMAQARAIQTASRSASGT